MSKSWANLVLGLKGQSLLHVLSYPWATLVCSPRYKISVCRRLTLGYGLPIVFFCFAEREKLYKKLYIKKLNIGDK